MTERAAPLALTMGEPAGIGLDITIAAWCKREPLAITAFALIGLANAVRNRAECLGLHCPIVTIGDIAEAGEVFPTALPVLDSENGPDAMAGAPAPDLAPFVVQSIRDAVGLTLSGRARAVVTNPISKAALHRTGFAYPGHTEFLAALAIEAGFDADPVMMLASQELRVVPATVHIALKDVPGALSVAGLLSTIKVTACELERRFGIAEPRMAVTGLNPHAGEDGVMGREEIDIIAPAIEAARAAGLKVSGPWPADTLFHAAARETYDAVIAMYHDQALIPFKTIAFDTGVNVTLGLPFVRTSPDHGTAFSLAGTGRASPASLIEAIRMADRMTAPHAG